MEETTEPHRYRACWSTRPQGKGKMENEKRKEEKGKTRSLMGRRARREKKGVKTKPTRKHR